MDLNQAKRIAIEIFEEYLKKGAAKQLDLPDQVYCKIYEKFGCSSMNKEDQFNIGLSHEQETPSLKLKDYNTSKLDDQKLTENLNKMLFNDIL